MNQEQFNTKIEELEEHLLLSLREECIRLFKSGAMNTDSFDDDFRLPKLCMHVALLNIAENYRPLSISLREIENLKSF